MQLISRPTAGLMNARIGHEFGASDACLAGRRGTSGRCVACAAFASCSLAALAATLLVASPARAQTPTGTIRGRVAPAPGATMPDLVRLRVTLAGTGLRTTTDSAGRFGFAAVAPGSYELAVDDAGHLLGRQSVAVIGGDTTNVVIELGAPAVELAPLAVTATRALHVIGHLPDVRGGVIYSGKKTEVIEMDSLRANLAQDVERQILGRIPGANFSETEGAGFPSNGVSFRGLDPTQSVEMNVRQNGVNIAADLYGYPETYYTPPAEALQRIEVVEGASSLAFGPQFGGMINYVVRDGAPHSPPALSATQTGGSFGLVNSFNAVGGGAGPWTYYAFLDYRGESGWRPNSDFRQISGYGSLRLRASDRLTLGLEYTLFRNRIHMPGGLSDSEFSADPRRSYRARNWLASPWNVAAARATYQISPHAELRTVLSYLASDRHLL